VGRSRDIGNTVTVLVHGWSSLILPPAHGYRPVGNCLLGGEVSHQQSGEPNFQLTLFCPLEAHLPTRQAPSNDWDAVAGNSKSLESWTRKSRAKKPPRPPQPTAS